MSERKVYFYVVERAHGQEVWGCWVNEWLSTHSRLIRCGNSGEGRYKILGFQLILA